MKKRYYAYALGLVLSVGLLLTGGAPGGLISAQSADSIYLTPASGTYSIGDTISVAIRENSSTQVNAATAHFTYTSNLSFTSIDGAGSAFGVDASSTGGSGSVTISRGSTSPLIGDQLISHANFKVLSAGTATFQMQNDSELLSYTTYQNVATTFSTGSYVLKVATVTPPTPTPTPTPTPAPTPTPTPAAQPKSQAATTIAPQGSAKTTALPGDSKVELKAPAVVETTPVQDKPVLRVEYLINGKVVSTDNAAPYSQSVNTDRMRNGSYKLTTKTYYKDGTIDTSNSSLVVKNPLDATQIWLQLRHYAWLIIILLIVIAELIYILFFKRRGFKNPYGNGPSASTGFGPVVGGGTGGIGGIHNDPSSNVVSGGGVVTPPSGSVQTFGPDKSLDSDSDPSSKL